MRTTVHRTPSRVTIRETLSNGQILTVWFFRDRNKPLEPWLIEYPDNQIAFVWKVAVYIGGIKDADRWVQMPYAKRVKKVRQTGTCGLEGMRRAMWHVIEHCERMKYREEMQLICEDAQRFRAYRWLIRHFNGFTEYVDPNNGTDHIGFRHPGWWTWKQDQKEDTGEDTTNV